MEYSWIWNPALADKVSNSVPNLYVATKFPAPAKTPCIPLILLPPKII